MKFLITILFGIFLNCTVTCQKDVTIKYNIITSLHNIRLPRTANLSYKNGKSLFVYDQGNGMICVDRDGRTGDENMTYKTVNESNSGSLMVDCYMQDSMAIVILLILIII
ncbi:MAG: hypothetical protein IPN89_18255 [Saprospiraceae bacterium]|nr:hypothetical protein [Saprospiraceae bacterium]